MPTERELNECEKVFLTPDVSDWNSHCESYELNERSMLDFEGNLSEPYRRLNHQVVFEDEEYDWASTMASVSASDGEANIDANVSTAFSVSPSVEHHSSPSYDVDFCKAINLRGAISKLSASIGSCNVSSDPCSVFYINKPSFSKWEEVELTLKLVLHPKELEYAKTKVSSAQA